MQAADERAHAPGADPSWWETWHLDVAGTDGTGIALRLACLPALGVAWWWTHVFVPGVNGPVVVRDHEVGLPRQGLEVRADGLWGELTCETPFEHWTYGLEAFGVRLDDPADSLRGEIGERLPVGLDIEWEVDADVGTPYEHGADTEVNGYEQFGRVNGEVLLGRSSFELDAVGLRSHAWGAARIDRTLHALWLRGPGVALSLSATDTRVDGYINRRGRDEPITSVRGERRRRADGLPGGAHDVVNDHLEVDTEVVGLIAIPLGEDAGSPATLTRGLCRFDVSDIGGKSIGGKSIGGKSIGGKSIGWSSWLDPR